MAPTPNHPFTFAQDLIAALVSAYAAVPLPLPSRRYISEGQIAIDCEQVVVEPIRSYRGTVNRVTDTTVPQRCFSLRTAEFRIWIIRCTSTPVDIGNGEVRMPNPDEIEAFSEPIITDLFFMPYSLQVAAVNGDLGVGCDDLLFQQANVHPPSGGYGGVNLIVEYQLGNG